MRVKEHVKVVAIRKLGNDIWIVLNMYDDRGNKIDIVEKKIDTIRDYGFTCDNFSFIPGVNIMMLEGKCFNSMQEFIDFVYRMGKEMIVIDEGWYEAEIKKASGLEL